MKQGETFLKDCTICEGKGDIFIGWQIRPGMAAEINKILHYDEKPDEETIYPRYSTIVHDCMAIGSFDKFMMPYKQKCETCQGSGKGQDYFEREYNPEDDEKRN